MLLCERTSVDGVGYTEGMADEHFRRLQAAGHTAVAFARFAKASPQHAEQYLTALEKNLRRVGATPQANAIKQVLAADGAFGDRIAAHQANLEGLFPKTRADWGHVQLTRAKTMQWDAEAYEFERFHYDNQPLATQAPLRLTGTLELPPWKPGAAARAPPIFTVDGRKYVLAETSRIMSGPRLQSPLVTAFVGDGPVTIEGVVSEDGKTLHVEGFALNVDGAYDQFVFGRVRDRVAGEPLIVDTPRGPVEIQKATLANKLAALPRLGVILPGPTTLDGDRRTYAGNPDEFFALAKWGFADPEKTKGGKRVGTADMAFNYFEGKPLEFPEKYLARAAETHGRFFAKGDVVMRQGSATRFIASYISQGGDAEKLAPSGLEADAVQAAVQMTTLEAEGAKKEP